jgi:hypothetical protein
MECFPDSCKMIVDHSEITWNPTLCLCYHASWARSCLGCYGGQLGLLLHIRVYIGLVRVFIVATVIWKRHGKGDVKQGAQTRLSTVITRDTL